MPLKLNTASSGSVTLTPADTASNYTITVPAQTATMAINGPAFNAYQSATQTFSGATATKIQFQSEEFDTNSNFDTSTYRFTPTVAGYYLLTMGFRLPTASRTSEIQLLIYKNGSEAKTTFDQTATNTYMSGMTTLVYANGTTDYFEAFAWVGTGGTTVVNQTQTYFSGVLVRAA